MSVIVDILVLAIVTVVIFYRLWRTLGMQVDIETSSQFSPGEVVILRDPEDVEQSNPNTYITGRVSALIEREPDFDEKQFTRAAERTFSKVVEAFAAGDSDWLARYMKQELCEAFQQSIEERKHRNQSRSCSVISIHSSIEEIDIIESTDKEIPSIARIHVLFESEQVIVTTEADGTSFDNPAKLGKKLKDRWIFEREIGASTPVWLVAQTENVHN